VDKKSHALGLQQCMAHLPADVMRDVLAALCRDLSLHDVALLQAAVRKLQAVVRAVPRMERFITELCTFVLAKEEEEGRGHGTRDMEDVIHTLKRWTERLKHTTHLQVRCCTIG
jgi:hypothetical protein